MMNQEGCKGKRSWPIRRESRNVSGNAEEIHENPSIWIAGVGRNSNRIPPNQTLYHSYKPLSVTVPNCENVVSIGEAKHETAVCVGGTAAAFSLSLKSRQGSPVISCF